MASWRSQLLTLSDALAPQPPARYAVEGLVRLPSLSIIYGAPGSLKTNLMIDLAVCAASGTPWLAPLPPDKSPAALLTHAVPVLWIDADSGATALRERFAAMARGHGVKKASIYFTSFLVPSFNAGKITSVRSMLALAQDISAGLIVIDNLAVVSPGADENSKEMAEVMSNLRFLGEKAGAGEIIIHHDPKHENSRKTPRGHSSIEAASDLALYVKREDEVVNLTATKARNDPIEPFSALWTWEHKPGTRQLQTAKFWGLEAERDPRRLEAERFVIAFLTQAGPGNQAEVIAAGAGQRISRGRVLMALDDLVRTGQIKVQAGQHNQRVYQT